jgi:hypothetical protein
MLLSFLQWSNSNQLNESIQAAKAYLIKRYRDSQSQNVEGEGKEYVPSAEDDRLALENPEYKKILQLVGDKPGYVYPFVKFRFENGNSLSQLRNLFQIIKDDPGIIQALPMSIEKYSSQRRVNGVDSLEELMSQINTITERRKHRWVIEKVNGSLRRSIKATLSDEEIGRLYDAAKVIDDVDSRTGPFIDPETGKATDLRGSLLKKSNAFSNAGLYLTWVEEMADGAANSSSNEKVKAITKLEPEAGVIYNRGGYLAISIRTERAQKKLCSVANWCINRGWWKNYAGKNGYLQINIFNFNRPVTDPMHITGTTIDNRGEINTSHDKNDKSLYKTNDPEKHFSDLGYPDDLVKAIVDSFSREKTIKQLIVELGVDTASPEKLLSNVITGSYKLNLESHEEIRNIMIEIINDHIGPRVSKQDILAAFMKLGVLSAVSAEILNLLIPDLSAEERENLVKNNDRILNSPNTGLKAIFLRKGRDAYPMLTAAVDDEEKIKSILNGTDTSDQN